MLENIQKAADKLADSTQAYQEALKLLEDAKRRASAAAEAIGDARKEVDAACDACFPPASGEVVGTKKTPWC